MKKIPLLLLLVSSFLLSGCLGVGESTTSSVPEGYRAYNGDRVSLVVPKEWEEIIPTSFASSVPKNTIVAFRSNILNTHFTATVVVVANDLSAYAEKADSLDYAKALLRKTRNELTGYREISAKEDSIQSGDAVITTLLTEVEGRESAEADVKHFIQKSGVKDTHAYVITGSFLSNDTGGTSKKVMDMVNSFGIK